ncbi:MAG: hypothetical protein J5621_00625 [Paludibacteraceae bacterium]|nr:hypothetical protein [Paludibacteraceae bacterium]
MNKKSFLVFLFNCIIGVSFAQTLQLKTDSLALAISEVSTLEGCRAHRNTVNAAAAYCLYTPYLESDIVHQACRKVIVEWAENTDELNLFLSPNMHKGLVGKEAKLMLAYFAAADMYAINSGIKETTLDAYSYAMEETLQYYVRNKKDFGKSKYWEKLHKLTKEERIARYTDLYTMDHSPASSNH